MIDNVRECPIGMMDSGLGGLSVLKEAVRILPNEDFIYYGDSANAPYGTKTPEQIRNCTLGVVEKLRERNIKALVIACNTATAATVGTLRDIYKDMPIVGIEPALKPAVLMNHGGRVIVMATPMTIGQEKYKTLLSRYDGMADIVSIGCKGLMEFVEEGIFEQEELDAYFDEHLLPNLTYDTESIVLGCTHYPFLRKQIMTYLEKTGHHGVQLLDGSLGTAMELRHRLAQTDRIRFEQRPGEVTILNSSDDPGMIIKSKKLFERTL